MKHPLSRFAPSPSLASLCEAGGERPQRGGAALARGRWSGRDGFMARSGRSID